MDTETSKNIRVGLFVLIATALLIFTLYLIGSKQNLFGSTFTIKAQFHDVNGLMSGNNVRFTGIDVGTVNKVEIINDSTVNVEMMIQNKVQQFIKKNSIATVGSDGLMGNKLINIIASNSNSPAIENGDILRTKSPVGTEELMKTLSVTNLNARDISIEIKSIVEKLNSSNSVWSILMDTVIAENVKHSIIDVRKASENTKKMTDELFQIISDTKNGKGALGGILADSIVSKKIRRSVQNVEATSDSLQSFFGNLKMLSNKLNKQDGVIGSMINDTSINKSLQRSIQHVELGTKSFDESMQALKHNFLLRSYFKKSKLE
jgi:phospholipid/cholesterol/gamma-HCH transport system substrate-binding protein